MARPDFLQLLPELDGNKDGTLDDGEIVLQDGAATRLQQLVTAERGGIPCPGKVERIETSGPDGGLFEIRFGPCAGDAAELKIRLGSALTAISSGHRHTAFVHAADSDTPKDSIVFGKDAAVAVPVGPPAAPTAPAPSSAPPAAVSTFLGAVVLGLRSFFSSVDPTLFLVGLIAVVLGHTSTQPARATKRLLAWSALMFVAASAITLTLSVLGSYTPRPLVVRALCALSLTYIGLDTVFLRPAGNTTRPVLPPDSWMIAGAFGLMHGFALAALSAGNRWASPLSPLRLLAGLQLGVALATLGCLGLLLPCALLLRGRGLVTKKALLPTGASIALLGLYCFVRRVSG